MISQWIRKIHRWIVVPLIVGLAVTLIAPPPAAAAGQPPPLSALVGILSLLTLFVTGLYMFVQHYWAKWRRSRRLSANAFSSIGSEA